MNIVEIYLTGVLVAFGCNVIRICIGIKNLLSIEAKNYGSVDLHYNLSKMTYESGSKPSLKMNFYSGITSLLLTPFFSWLTWSFFVFKICKYLGLERGEQSKHPLHEIFRPHFTSFQHSRNGIHRILQESFDQGNFSTAEVISTFEISTQTKLDKESITILIDKSEYRTDKLTLFRDLDICIRSIAIHDKPFMDKHYLYKIEMSNKAHKFDWKLISKFNVDESRSVTWVVKDNEILDMDLRLELNEHGGEMAADYLSSMPIESIAVIRALTAAYRIQSTQKKAS